MERIRIFGKNYTVRMVPTNEMEIEDCAHLDAEKLEISMYEGFNLELEQDTLLHEVVHAIDNELNLKLTEKQVARIATGLLAVMKDNFDFVIYLIKEKR